MTSYAIAVAGILVVLAAGSAEARTRFEGAAVITSKSGTCEYDPTGARYHVRFRPANVSDNGPWSALSFFQLNGAMSFQLDNGRFTKTPKTVRYQEVYDGHWEGEFPVKVAFTGQVPADIKPTSNFVDVTGTISNFDQMKGCTVTFRFGATRRLEN